MSSKAAPSPSKKQPRKFGVFDWIVIVGFWAIVFATSKGSSPASRFTGPYALSECQAHYQLSGGYYTAKEVDENCAGLRNYDN
jgi:hypothetical protein